MTPGSVAHNLNSIRERIARAAERSGRDPQAVSLVAVTKRVEPDAILEAYHAGARDFGESYLQEALAKQSQLAPGAPDARWHFIGHLQSNKARSAATRFELIHSVDSSALARRIAQAAQSQGRAARILIEIQLDPEKFGVEPAAAASVAREIASIPGLSLQGLMGMAPFSRDAEEVRAAFRRLANLFQDLPDPHRQILSMGMSNDFEIAVEEGATLVRVGTAIFGPRL